MSGAVYSIYLSDPFGVRLGDASSFLWLKLTRVTNDIGTVVLALPSRTRGRAFDMSLIRAPDGRLEVWRRLPGSSRETLVTDTVWLIKVVTTERDDTGRETIIIEADVPLCLLREPGRFANHNADSGSAEYTGPLDDGIKFVADTNIGFSAGLSRQLVKYITIAPNLSLAPSDSKSFAWRDCLKVMQEMANASAEQGVYLAFDIVTPSPSTLELRTYTSQRGADHRFPSGLNPVIIGPEFGNMGECSLTTDWRDEITYAKAGGRGEGSDRLTAEAQDDTRIGTSPFGLREKFVNATQYETSTGLQAEAEAAVRAGRPRQIFRGKILDVPDTRYGVHWAWGDFVTIQAFGQSFDARIDAVEVEVSDGQETINAWVRGDL